MLRKNMVAVAVLASSVCFQAGILLAAEEDGSSTARPATDLVGGAVSADLVTICHKGRTIQVAGPAVPAHLRHGDTLGPCDDTGCTVNEDCGAGDYCMKAPGDCDGIGECSFIPEFCADIYDPVCGCDGQTYSNACVAAMSGVNVETAGECPIAGCTVNEECAAGDFCMKAPGDCDGIGMCDFIPDFCPGVYDPVCGCDGQTYSNACVAAMSGVNVETLGECPIAGCTVNEDCAAGDFCMKAPGDCDGIGMCDFIPDFCPGIYDPVCGCDGQTYSNSCVAAMSGVNVETLGECPIAGCTVNEDCAAGDFCMKAPGDCDGIGMCDFIPDFCPGIYDPVCGCDGQTYSNSCVAAMSGVNVETLGECPIAGCTVNEECAAGDFCMKAPGDCDGIGMCDFIPDFCPGVYDPVCGCDGQTYSNACVAAMSGVNVETLGECPIAGCTVNEDCSAGDFCMKAPGDCDGIGMCDFIPDFCPGIYDPVCGCDGQTYSNSCVAAMSGVNVETLGECPIAGCTVNEDCSAGDFCMKAPGDCDGIGMCDFIPDFCPGIYDPVCGCDGQTYSNSCVAAMSGVNVETLGECPIAGCTVNEECAAGDFCMKAPGDCDGIGMCDFIPDFCPGIYDPVCGCDGQTYSNSCVAAMSGVNVETLGECPIAGCTVNEDCSAGDFCMKAPGDCDGIGMCDFIPDFCPGIYDPVCGCDGQTYSNSCVAAMSGVNVETLGECPIAGCTVNEDCSAGDFCMKAPGDCDGIGMCDFIPDFCPGIYDPVCGCDGQTYSNSCVAAMSGVNVETLGECPIAGCTVNEDCSAGDFCMKAPGDCDGIGMCDFIPDFCPGIYDPVCGCDGQTYSNSCVAAMSGVNVDSSGECG